VPTCVAPTRRPPDLFLEESILAKIPQVLHEHINAAYPANVCLIGTVLPNGFAQITPRGSTMVFDDENIALWERGRGTTTENLTDGTPVTIFMRKPALREAGILPKGGILRLYGRAKIHKSGPIDIRDGLERRVNSDWEHSTPFGQPPPATAQSETWSSFRCNSTDGCRP
jgi:hypothetical protein